MGSVARVPARARIATSYMEAVKWWRLAADRGNSRAQYNLGSCYAKGEGVAKDHKEAVKWWRLAAEQGDPYAQYNLGFSYHEGIGVLQSQVDAYAWFSLSSYHGLTEGTEARDELASKMTPSQIEKAQGLSKQLLKQIEKKARQGE